MLGHYFLACGQNIWQTGKCSILRLEIWLLLHSNCDELIPGKIDKAIALKKQRHPERSHANLGSGTNNPGFEK